MFEVQGFRAPELGNTSYLVADVERGAGIVVDPVRDIEGYLDRADEMHIKITHALDTHLHNDFVSGRRELAAETGASIDEVQPAGELTVGGMTIRAIHTPGHTPDHKAYLVSADDHPRALFSGGAVMLGAIARTDLFGPHLAVHLGLEALSTLQVRLRGLPDDLAVLPTHGSGSFCGTGGRSGHETTLGHERKSNPFFLTTEVMPFLARALNQHRYPTYYRDMAAINEAGAALLGRTLPPLVKLAAGDVAGAVHIYVPDVPHRADEIPREAPVAVHCASGYRAGIAASLLEQAGLKRIIHVNGEYSDWDRLHLAESKV